MNAEIIQLIDEKAKRTTAHIVKRAFAIYTAVCISLMISVFLLELYLPVNPNALALVMGTMAMLFLSALYSLTLIPTFRLRRLINANHRTEAHRLADQLVLRNLQLAPMSFLVYTSTLQLNLFLQEAAYIEVYAWSEFIKVIIQKSPFFFFSRWLMLPAFENYLGIALMGMERHEEALEKFQECLKSGSKLSKNIFLNNIGVCQMQLGRHEEAYSSYSQAIAASSRIAKRTVAIPAFYPNLARVCLKLNKLEEAERIIEESARHFETSKSNDPFRANFYEVVGLLKAAQGHYDEAELHLRSAIELHTKLDSMHPNLQDANLELATVLEKLGRDEEADNLRKVAAECKLRLQLRQADSEDKLLSALRAGSHPISLLGRPGPT